MLLPAAERQQWQQQLLQADSDLAAAVEVGCDCRPPKWNSLYGKPAASSVGAAGAAAVGGVAVGSNGGSNSRPGSPLVLGSSVCAVPCAAGNVCAAVYAVSALWALVHNGEKVKAALRKLPAAAARLTAVKMQSQQLALTQQVLQQEAAAPDVPSSAAAVGGIAAGSSLTSQRQQGSRLGPGWIPQQQQQQASAVATMGPCAVVGGRGVLEQQQGAQGVGGVFVQPGVLCGPLDVSWWLSQLQDSCGALLDLMDRC